MAANHEGDFLAKPSGECCMKGTIHEGQPRGTYEIIASVNTYIARPDPGKANGNIVLYFPDVWGLFTNGLLIVDGFADAGYMTLALDYFRDDPVWKHRKDRKDQSNPDFDYEAWKMKHTTYADEYVPKWVDEVKKKFGAASTKFACVGYCFGAPYVCNELAKSTVVAGAFAHPAFLKAHHFEHLERWFAAHCKEYVEADHIHKIEPLFLSCSEIDHTFETAARRTALDIMQKRRKTYQLQLFSGVEHGFALRGDLNDPYQRYVKEQSLQAIVHWFDYWLSI